MRAWGDRLWTGPRQWLERRSGLQRRSLARLCARRPLRVCGSLHGAFVVSIADRCRHGARTAKPDHQRHAIEAPNTSSARGGGASITGERSGPSGAGVREPITGLPPRSAGP
jgi:hypothetical protein